jgi:hypothetical protein
MISENLAGSGGGQFLNKGLIPALDKRDSGETLRTAFNKNKIRTGYI